MLLIRTRDYFSGVPWYMKGSPVCDTMTTLNRSQFDDVNQTNITGLLYRSECGLNDKQYTCGIASIVVIFVFLILFKRFIERKIRNIDLVQQTASDYSLEVCDPDIDANDPDEWYQYFSKFGKVGAVYGRIIFSLVSLFLLSRWLQLQSLSITVSTHFLLQSEKQCTDSLNVWAGMLIKELASLRFTDAVIDTLPRDAGSWLELRYPFKHLSSKWRGTLRDLGIGRDRTWWVRKHRKQTEIVKVLLAAFYVVSKVFATFEHEAELRSCLKKLSVGALVAAMDLKTAAVPRHLAFRGTNVLEIRQAPEPSEILWKKIGTVTEGQKFSMHVILDLFTLLMMTIVTLIAVQTRQHYGQLATGLVISTANCMGPYLIDEMVKKYEVHSSVTKQVNSCFYKKCLFRCWNSAGILFLYTTHSELLEPKFQQQLQILLLCDMVIVPLNHSINVFYYSVQYISKKIVTSQQELNSLFTGSEVKLHDMYSDISKTFFVCLFYLPLLPVGPVIGAVTYILIYWVHKHALLNHWRTAELCNLSGILTRSMHAQACLALLVHVYMANRFYYEWPFDEICRDSDGTLHPCNKLLSAYVYGFIYVSGFREVCSQ